jgi:hypothetical protein
VCVCVCVCEGVFRVCHHAHTPLSGAHVSTLYFSVASSPVTMFNASCSCLQANITPELPILLVNFTSLNHFDVSGNPGLGGGGVSAILASIAGMFNLTFETACAM